MESRIPSKVFTDTNNHNSCMTKHILPYNFNICYCIYLKLTDVSGIGMTGANMHNTILNYQQELLPLFYLFTIVLYGKTGVK